MALLDAHLRGVATDGPGVDILRMSGEVQASGIVGVQRAQFREVGLRGTVQDLKVLGLGHQRREIAQVVT